VRFVYREQADGTRLHALDEAEILKPFGRDVQESQRAGRHAVVNGALFTCR
jgi:hypothetical protein